MMLHFTWSSKLYRSNTKPPIKTFPTTLRELESACTKEKE